jgi:hypothetical protein
MLNYIWVDAGAAIGNRASHWISGGIGRRRGETLPSCLVSTLGEPHCCRLVAPSIGAPSLYMSACSGSTGLLSANLQTFTFVHGFNPNV